VGTARPTCDARAPSLASLAPRGGRATYNRPQVDRVIRTTSFATLLAGSQE